MEVTLSRNVIYGNNRSNCSHSDEKDAIASFSSECEQVKYLSERRKKMLLNKSITLGISTAKKQLKPILFCLVALSALVLLAACGGSSTNTGTTPTTGTTSTPAATPTATATQAGNAQTVMIITDSTGS